jgi:hypothetical protein
MFESGDNIANNNMSSKGENFGNSSNNIRKNT